MGSLASPAEAANLNASYIWNDTLKSATLYASISKTDYPLGSIQLIKSECTNPIGTDNCYADISFSTPYNFSGKSILGYNIPSLVNDTLKFNILKGNIKGYRFVTWEYRNYSANITDYKTVLYNKTVTDGNGTYNITLSNTTKNGWHWQNTTSSIEVPLFSNLNDALALNKFRIYGTVTKDSKIDWIGSFFGVEVPEMAWWNTSWNSTRALTNNSNIPVALTDYQFQFNITRGSCNANYSDLRITDITRRTIAKYKYGYL
jgi:hypothetical protein